eukprot:TRINITY_DN7461_c0_g1_i1.p1 TRINITY_DN7461_c0_g1~~TRINITY_DN7461_c0_g1_i1.p1  ORF type:complete len:379 (-),score=135.95 TRINITY_DN7461_c0_g1_i1:154-1260(-)
MGEEQDQTLRVINECFIYKIPPRASGSGYKAADWDLTKPIFSGRIVISARGPIAVIKIEDLNTGKLFATCLSRPDGPPAVEKVEDSSRYFALRIEDGNTGRHAYIGLGFTDRNNSFDFSATLQDHSKYLRQQQEAKQASNQPAVDLSLAEGQTIHVNIKTKKPAAATAQTKLSAPTGTGLLPPPPGSGLLPPPPGRQAVQQQPQQQFTPQQQFAPQPAPGTFTPQPTPGAFPPQNFAPQQNNIQQLYQQGRPVGQQGFTQQQFAQFPNYGQQAGFPPQQQQFPNQGFGIPQQQQGFGGQQQFYNPQQQQQFGQFAQSPAAFPQQQAKPGFGISPTPSPQKAAAPAGNLWGDFTQPDQSNQDNLWGDFK